MILGALTTARQRRRFWMFCGHAAFELSGGMRRPRFLANLAHRAYTKAVCARCAEVVGELVYPRDQGRSDDR